MYIFKGTFRGVFIGCLYDVGPKLPTKITTPFQPEDFVIDLIKGTESKTILLRRERKRGIIPCTNSTGYRGMSMPIPRNYDATPKIEIGRGQGAAMEQAARNAEVINIFWTVSHIHHNSRSYPEIGPHGCGLFHTMVDPSSIGNFHASI